jgi:hypothetical protein
MQKVLFSITEITKFGQIFKIFSKEYGNGDKYLFYINNTQVKEEDTIVDLGFEPTGTDKIEIQAYKTSSSSRKSPTIKLSSSKKSPKISSSKKSPTRKLSSSRKSPKISSSRKSPKISIE